MSCVRRLYYDCLGRAPLYPSFYRLGARIYKEDSGQFLLYLTGTLSLLAYFTYIFIDIIIYALGARHDPLESSEWWTES